MRIIRRVQRSLGLKIFISYLVIIAVGVTTMGVAAQGVAPLAFARHMERMMNSGMMGSASMMTTLFADFRSALWEAVSIAGAASLVAAVAVSYYVSRRILVPVREMMSTSRQMAAGRYSRRVQVPSADELGDLAHNFNTLAEALEQAEERRRELIADITHELRTPLATIKSYMEGLVDGVLPAEPATYNLVHGEAERLSRLIQDLQDLSRAEAKQLYLRRRRTGVAPLVEAAASRLAPQFQAKGVHLETSVPDRLPQVSADEDRIIQVLLNLLTNALHYTPVGGRVRVLAARRGPEVQVSVTDTGPGIPAEHLERVFQRFYRVDRSRSRSGGGSGLGLTIARYIVEAHGGRIWAESPVPGGGSTFTFTLPVDAS